MTITDLDILTWACLLVTTTLSFSKEISAFTQKKIFDNPWFKFIVLVVLGSATLGISAKKDSRAKSDAIKAQNTADSIQSAKDSSSRAFINENSKIIVGAFTSKLFEHGLHYDSGQNKIVSLVKDSIKSAEPVVIDCDTQPDWDIIENEQNNDVIAKTKVSICCFNAPARKVNLYAYYFEESGNEFIKIGEPDKIIEDGTMASGKGFVSLGSLLISKGKELPMSKFYVVVRGTYENSSGKKYTCVFNGAWTKRDSVYKHGGSLRIDLEKKLLKLTNQ